jgi:hypothetical protein
LRRFSAKLVTCKKNRAGCAADQNRHDEYSIEPRIAKTLRAGALRPGSRLIPFKEGHAARTALPHALFLTAVPVLAVFAIMYVCVRKRVTGLRANFPIAGDGEHHHGQASKHGKSFSHCRFLGCMNETLQRKAAAARRVGAMKIS